MEEKDLIPQELPAEELPAAEMPALEIHREEIPAEEAPMEETPAEEIPAEEIPVEEAPAEEVPAEEVSVEEAPAEEAPAEEIPAVEVPAEEIPAVEVPAEEIPAVEVPAEEIPAEEAPAEEAPVEEAPVEEAPVEEAPAEEVPVEETPAEEISVQEHELLTSPELGEEITPHEAALSQPELTHPDAANAPFDLSILDDPDLDLAAELGIKEEEPAADGEYRDPDSDFEEMFAAPEQKEEVPSHDRPTRKGRPKRKKGEGFLGIPHILATVIWLTIIVAAGVTLGRMLWVCAAEVLAFGREDKVVTVTIYESDTIDDVTDKLHKAGLIRYPQLFKLYASLAVDEGEIDPGIWDLNTRYDYHALVNFMNASSSRTVISDLLIPEGYTCRQIFELLEEKKVCTAKDLEAYAASGELKDYWFLEGVERGTANCLEGFLFPDTYDFYKNSSPREVLEKLMDNFNTRFDEELQAQLPALNDHLAEMMRNDGRSEEFIAANTFTVRELIIVASMIEKETSGNAESHTIASVIYNRLFNWGGTPAYLGIDATIVYALGGKTNLTSEDLQIDSPYNTRTHVGLTPGPIANPGLASIKAALNPETTDYYFYVLNPATGKHQFSSTLEEHEGYVAQFAAAGGTE